ncbi:MAG: YjfB family protein [Acetivibrionales bacterium]|jgi:hypothetical protein
MIYMDVAALSVSMKHSRLIQQVGITVLKKAMESAQTNTEDLLKALEQSVTPSLGQNVDIKL